MKLLYTDVPNDLTKLLAQEAQTYVDVGKRVFYIAPNSLSFEKERKVLECLPQRSSFAITVTRFGQLARYLTLSSKASRPRLDDLGLSMVLYRVLSGLSDDQLKRYQLLQSDPAFVAQLVDFYKEWQSSDLTIEDLTGVTSDHLADLCLIMGKLEEALTGLDFATQSAISQLRQDLTSHSPSQTLEDVVLVIDGFTRFTAEEEGLIAQLNEVCHQVVIGVYASPTAYSLPYQAGQLYQASVEFLQYLAQTFETKPSYIGLETVPTPFSRLTQLLENRYAYREASLTLSETDQAAIQLWQVAGVKEELEQVAQAIRTKLAAGYRYKDILVLLGEVSSYELQLQQVFDTYAIPYYLGQAESMADHPLVQVIDSLERLHRYHYRAEDLLNLLKSGLVGQFDALDLDRFDQYVIYAALKGKQAFSRPFTKTKKGLELEPLNAIREAVMSDLQGLLDREAAPIATLLAALLALFEQWQLRQNLETLARQGSQLDAERHEQVWKTFCGILEQLQLIFGEETISLTECLAILRSGMLAATYRLVPATVDVVTVKSYQMIEPHTKPLVFAIGLTQSNFPEIVTNVSLLSDEERLAINSQLTQGQFELPSSNNLKRNNYVFVSLINAATQELVLSSPSTSGEGQSMVSSYLHQLVDLGLPMDIKGRQAHAPQDFASYRSLLGRLVEAYQADLRLDELDKTSADTWAVLIRRLQQKMAEQGLSLPEVSSAVTTSPLSPETLAVRYPEQASLRLSASSLSDFYNNEYKFFLTHVLGLSEEETILPDARQHGIFFHRVFELVTQDQSTESFDQKLDWALAKASQEPELAASYQQTAQTRFAQELMVDMVKATAQVLKDQSQIEVVAQEQSFGVQSPFGLTLPNGRQLTISGKMDRLDKLVISPSYGVVDYKSGDKRFKLSDVYNKLTPQLLTYLAALQQSPEFSQVAAVFGAMYLRVQQPQVSLAQTANRDEILRTIQKDLTYKGIFVADQVADLGKAHEVSKANTYDPAELAVLLAYQTQLYQEAATKILSGSFAINPYTRDGYTVAGDQLKSITRFEADLHMGQARHLSQFPVKDQRSLILGAMAEQLGADKEDHHV